MKKIIFFLIITFIIETNIYADTNMEKIEPILLSTTDYVIKTIPDPSYGSVGGDWAVFGLLRSGMNIPEEYTDIYYDNIEEYVKKSVGVLHKRKYTEYSRVIISLTAIGENPENFAGYNLVTPISDYEKVMLQGINGAVWALIAADCGGYDEINRDLYINEILNRQNPDGGFSLARGGASEVDITCMVLTALSKYRGRGNVKNAVENALSWLSLVQNEYGGFSDYGTETAESTAQAIVALCELKIPIDDERFIKNGNTLLDNLLTFYNPSGGFYHGRNETASNQMATEQCLCALAALKRYYSGENSIYSIKKAQTKHLPFIIEKSENWVINSMIYNYEAKKYEFKD